MKQTLTAILIIFTLSTFGQVKQLKNAYALSDTLYWVKTTDTLLTDYAVVINDESTLKLVQVDTIFVHYEFLASKLRLFTEVRNKKYIIRKQEKMVWGIKPKNQQFIIL